MDEPKQSVFARAGEVLNIEFPLFVGFTGHLVWTYLIFSDFLHHMRETVSGPGSAHLIFGIAFAVVCVLFCFAVGIMREYITMSLRHKTTHLVIAACGALGCVLYYRIDLSDFAYAAAIGSALLLGAAFSLISILWGEASRRRTFTRLATITCISLLAAAVASPLLEFLASARALEALVCIAPLPLAVFLYKAQHDNESYFKPQEFEVLPDGTRRAKEGILWEETYHDLKISKLRFAIRLGRSALFFGLAFGLFLYESLLYLQDREAVFSSAWSLAFALLAVLVFVLLFSAFNPVVLANPSKRLFSFFIAFMLFSSCGSMAADRYVAGPETVALFALLAVMLWNYPAELSHRYRISALLTFGFFASFLGLGAFMAIICCLAGVPSMLPWPLMAIAAVVFTSVGFALLINDKQMRSIAIVETVSVDASSEAPFKGPGAFVQRCHKAADIYLLSRREEEILFLLAKGRNASYVQKELVISKGTAKTHMRNIYRKMDVHNQQELMDLVETLPLGEGALQ